MISVICDAQRVPASMIIHASLSLVVTCQKRGLTLSHSRTIVPDIYNQQVVTLGFLITNNIAIPNLEVDKGVAK